MFLFSKKFLLLLSILVLFSPITTYSEIYDYQGSQQVKPKATLLKIISRHESEILADFETAFLSSSFAADVGFSSGDRDLVDFLQVTTLPGWDNALTGDFGVDLAWGGGPTLFNQMIEAGGLQPYSQPMIDYIAAENIPGVLAGVPMNQSVGSDLYWVANAISSFGFTVNHDVLESFGLPVPKTWEDLASSIYFLDTSIDTFALGNPTHTTSNTRIYQIILQKFMEDNGTLNWDKGWEILSRMAGNGGIFGESLPTRAACIQGEVAICMTIDFYGVFSQRENSRTEYIIPEGGSIVNGDPIAFGVNMNSQPEAEAFVKFVSSPEGQAIWVKHDRLPINPDAFLDPSIADRTDVAELYNKTLSNQGIEFDEDLSLATEFTMQEYFESAIVDAHSSLKAAWGPIAKSHFDGDITDAELDAAAKKLFRPQLSIQEAIDRNKELKDNLSYRDSRKSSWFAKAIECYNADGECAIDTTSFFLTPTTTSDSTSDSTSSGTSATSTSDTISSTPPADDAVDDVPFSTISMIIALIAIFVVRPIKRKKSN